MKKKAVAALLAAGLSLNLCGCSAYGVAMKMMQDYEPEQSQDWAVEAQLPEEEEILESEESEETGNEDAEETVIAGKDQSEKTSVEMPEELSDNLYDFQIAMDGQVYKFPMILRHWAGNISVTGQKCYMRTNIFMRNHGRRTVLRFILPLQIYL